MNEEIPNEWFRRAENEEDPYYKFMSIYVALNFLYNADRGDESERECMVSYLSKVAGEIEINLQSESEFLRKPVIDMKNKVSYPVIDGDLKSLFNAIYTVRCNLFPGNKMLGSDRDRALVEESANVLIKVIRHRLCSTDS